MYKTKLFLLAVFLAAVSHQCHNWASQLGMEPAALCRGGAHGALSSKAKLSQVCTVSCFTVQIFSSQP